MRHLKKSLLARLVVYFWMPAFLTVVLLGILAFLHTRNALETSAFDRLSVAATVKANALTQWVDDQREDLLLMARLPAVQLSAKDLLRYDAADPTYHTAYTALRQTVAAASEHKAAWHEVFILSEKGRVLFSTNPAHEGDQRALDPYFTEGRTRTFVQNVYASPETSQPATTLATPLPDETSPQRGVLAVHLNLEHVEGTLLERPGLDPGSESYLVDPSNAFLSSERFDQAASPRRVHSEGIDAALQGRDGAGLYLNYQNVPVIGVYRWLDALEAALLVEMPQHAAFAPVRRLVWAILLVGLILSALLTAVTYRLARQIARPILGITDAALQVADGNLSVTAPVLTDDEIGVLARTFNEMTDRLRMLRENLDQEITVRKQAQRERERFVEELKAKNAELERFTYTVSHDLKSPLVTIRGFAGLLEKDADKGDTQRMKRDIQQIQDAAEKMQQLLAELLELSRVGRLINPPEEVSLTALAHEAVELVTGCIKERGVEVDIDPAMPVTYGDRGRLLEVLQNLLDNAVKFMGDQPAPRIEIGGRRDTDEVVCFVQDNGVGIDPKYHEQIFGLFDRLDPRSEGTGIGLALVKRIVEAHGGRIRVESEGAGRGSTFRFTVPLQPGDLPRRKET